MHTISDIPAIILAGGKGTRLRSVVSDCPKVLASVDGKPYLAYVLDRLAALGVPQTIISTGYMAETVEETLGNIHKGMALLYAQEETPLGTAGGTRFAASKIEAAHYLVLNGDSWCAADFASYVQTVPTTCDAGMLLTKVDDVSRYGAVQINSENRVESFCEKGEAHGPGTINAGVYMLSQNVINAIPKGKKLSLEHDVFPNMAPAGRIYGHKVEAPFIDIGTPESYARVLAFFKEHLNK